MKNELIDFFIDKPIEILKQQGKITDLSLVDEVKAYLILYHKNNTLKGEILKGILGEPYVNIPFGTSTGDIGNYIISSTGDSSFGKGKETTTGDQP